MATTSKIQVTEGSGKNVATYSVTEDAVTKEIQRIVISNSAGTEMGTVASPFEVDLATTISGEDVTNDRMKVEQRFQGLMVATSTQILGAAGFIHTVTVMCNDSAPTAGTINVYDNPSNTGVKKLSIAITTTYFNPYTLILNEDCPNGIYVEFITTADVNVNIAYRLNA